MLLHQRPHHHMDLTHMPAASMMRGMDAHGQGLGLEVGVVNMDMGGVELRMELQDMELQGMQLQGMELQMGVDGLSMGEPYHPDALPLREFSRINNSHNHNHNLNHGHSHNHGHGGPMNNHHGGVVPSMHPHVHQHHPLRFIQEEEEDFANTPRQLNDSSNNNNATHDHNHDQLLQVLLSLLSSFSCPDAFLSFPCSFPCFCFPYYLPHSHTLHPLTPAFSDLIQFPYEKSSLPFNSRGVWTSRHRMRRSLAALTPPFSTVMTPILPPPPPLLLLLLLLTLLLRS